MKKRALEGVKKRCLLKQDKNIQKSDVNKDKRQNKIKGVEKVQKKERNESLKRKRTNRIMRKENEIFEVQNVKELKKEKRRSCGCRRRRAHKKIKEKYLI